jgi:hypothetical protein
LGYLACPAGLYKRGTGTVGIYAAGIAWIFEQKRVIVSYLYFNHYAINLPFISLNYYLIFVADFVFNFISITNILI